MSGYFSQKSQRASSSQNSTQNNIQDTEVEADILLSKISKIKGLLMPMTKRFFENNVNFNTEFGDDTKEALKEHMTGFLTYENQLKMLQQASSQLQFETSGLSQNLSSEESIASILENSNLDEKFNAVLNEIKQSNTFNAVEDEQYKSLLHMLGEEGNGGDNEDVEMLETDFTIPIDPFSRMEIVNPVRNKSCNHLYDKEKFFAMFETRPRGSYIKCPFTGCLNKKVGINDVEEDARLKILIDNAKRQQQS